MALDTVNVVEDPVNRKSGLGKLVHDFFWPRDSIGSHAARSLALCYENDGTKNQTSIWNHSAAAVMFALVTARNYLIRFTGWVAERLKAPVLKTGRPARVSWVRIPPHPPTNDSLPSEGMSLD
jgi:hypothetical protein